MNTLAPTGGTGEPKRPEPPISPPVADTTRAGIDATDARRRLLRRLIRLARCMNLTLTTGSRLVRPIRQAEGVRP